MAVWFFPTLPTSITCKVPIGTSIRSPFLKEPPANTWQWLLTKTFTFAILVWKAWGQWTNFCSVWLVLPKEKNICKARYSWHLANREHWAWSLAVSAANVFKVEAIMDACTWSGISCGKAFVHSFTFFHSLCGTSIFSADWKNGLWVNLAPSRVSWNSVHTFVSFFTT